MSDYTTANKGKMFYSGSNSGTVTFGRPCHSMIITVSSNVTMGLTQNDGYMDMTAGTYQFDRLNIDKLYFGGSGTWSGYGIAI